MRASHRYGVAAAVIVGAGIASVLAFGVFRSSAANSLPASFAGAQAELASGYGITVNPPSSSSSASALVSQSDAVAQALKNYGLPANTPGVSATLVNATDPSFTHPQPDGSSSAVLQDTTVWLVLIPNMQIPVPCPATSQCGGAMATVTKAVFVDARTGAFLIGSALHSTN